jgi:hypothetical protein
MAKTVGNELVYLVQENSKHVSKRYAAKGAVVVNSLESLSANAIILGTKFYQRYTDGGRRTLAKNLSVAMQPLHPANYHQARTMRYFKNTFEFPAGWHAEGKVVDNMAFNGKHSCLVNKEVMYSSVFRYSLANLDPQRYSEVLISFRCKSKDANTKPSLVVSIENDAKGLVSWQAFAVTTHDYEDWTWFHQSCSLSNYTPDDFIKLYVTQTLEGEFYMDDFVVEFPEK